MTQYDIFAFDGGACLGYVNLTPEHFAEYERLSALHQCRVRLDALPWPVKLRRPTAGSTAVWLGIAAVPTRW